MLFPSKTFVHIEQVQNSLHIFVQTYDDDVQATLVAHKLEQRSNDTEQGRLATSLDDEARLGYKQAALTGSHTQQS